MYLLMVQKPSTAAHWIRKATVCFKSGTLRLTTLSLSFKGILMWWGVASFLGFSEEPKLITAKLLHLKEVQTALEHDLALSSGVHMGKTQTSSANSLDCASIKTVWRSDTAWLWPVSLRMGRVRHLLWCLTQHKHYNSFTKPREVPETRLTWGWRKLPLLWVFWNCTSTCTKPTQPNKQ